MTELHELTTTTQRELLQSGQISPVELTTHYLERIEKYQPSLGSFATVSADLALDTAKKLTQSGPTDQLLWAIPLADKDLDDRSGVRTGYGSAAIGEFISLNDDAVVEAVDAAGAISLGKTAVPEFGLTGNTLNHSGIVSQNPWRKGFEPGGSSGGAAAATAAGLVSLATGSDAGGSIRIPAASCGVVGVKPTRQLLPYDGLFEHNRNSVHGPIARNVRDAALFLDALIGNSCSLQTSPHYQATLQEHPRLKIAVTDYTPWSEVYPISLNREQSGALLRSASRLADLGHMVDTLPKIQFDGYAAAFGKIWQFSAHRITVSPDREELLMPLTKWLRTEGASYSAQEIEAAKSTLELFEKHIRDCFADYDVVLSPVLSLLPQEIAWHDEADFEQNFAKQCHYAPYTSFLNIVGLPAISLPVGLSESGLPLAVQLIGSKNNSEKTLLNLAQQLESELNWRFRVPDLSSFE